MTNARRQAEGDIPAIEWFVAALGFAVTAGTIAFLTYHGLTGNSAPPDIRVEAQAIVATRNGYLVEILATNSGDATAAGVKVQGELRSKDGTVQTAETTFDYVPSHSSRRGGLIFMRDARAGSLHLHASGYQNP